MKSRKLEKLLRLFRFDRRRQNNQPMLNKQWNYDHRSSLFQRKINVFCHSTGNVFLLLALDSFAYELARIKPTLKIPDIAVVFCGGNATRLETCVSLIETTRYTAILSIKCHENPLGR